MASVKKSKKEPPSPPPTEPEEPAGLVKLIQRLNQKKEPENTVQSPDPTQPEAEKMYRVFNHSEQTIYVINTDGTHCLLPRGHLDVPEAKISEHIKLMARRGVIRLFEKEK